MSRRNPSPAEILVQLPWQVSAVLAVIAFVALRWVFPAIGSENKILNTFMQGGRGLAWPALILLGMLAVFSAMLARKKRALLDSQSDIDSLRALSWKEFEWMVGEAYRRQGYTVEEQLGGGADGGIDIVLGKGGQSWLVQCKRWKNQSVGAPVIREMFGLLNHHKAAGVIVVTSGNFTRDATSFAEGKPIELIDGPALLELVKGVQANSRPGASEPVKAAAVVSQTESPAPLTSNPICPKCGGAMVERVARKGANAGNSFWGCTNYPTCRGVRNA